MTTLNRIYRDLGAAWDALAAADDHTRAARLIDVAELFEELAESGESEPVSDLLTAQLLHALADVELVATGKLSRRHATSYPFERSLGPILDRMAFTVEVKGRAVMLADLALEIPDDGVAEVLACLPYADNRSGWTVDESMPSSRTWRGFAGAVGVVWRNRRAAS